MTRRRWARTTGIVAASIAAAAAAACAPGFVLGYVVLPAGSAVSDALWPTRYVFDSVALDRVVADLSTVAPTIDAIVVQSPATPQDTVRENGCWLRPDSDGGYAQGPQISRDWQLPPEDPPPPSPGGYYEAPPDAVAKAAMTAIADQLAAAGWTRRSDAAGVASPESFTRRVGSTQLDAWIGYDYVFRRVSVTVSSSDTLCSLAALAD